jgi:ferredoxin-NADP reductase
MYIGVWVAIEHQTRTGDMQQGGALAYWLTLNYTVFGSLLLYRFLRPLYLFARHRFEVSRIEKETNDVTSIYISGKNLEKFKFKSGQFAILYFLKKGMWEGHPYSFSAAPNGEYIRFSVKAIGDFSSQVPDLTQGTKVVIDGPLGVLTEKAKTDKYLLIAGGIGIAPFLSLSESLSKNKKDVILLYSNKTKNGTIFEKELLKLPIKTHFFLTDETNFDYFGFKKGRIDKEQISSLAPDFKEREIYICGPLPMMDAMENTLYELGVSPKKIHMEKFMF